MRLFDLHADTLNECYTKKYPLLKNSGHFDLWRAAQYAPYVQGFAVWIDDAMPQQDAWTFCCNVLDLAEEEERENKGKIHFLRKGESLACLTRQYDLVGLLAVEGGGMLAADRTRIAQLASRGVQYVTLTWNGSNALGHGCLSSCADGLTEEGKKVLCELESVGIYADTAHLNPRGFWDVASLTTRPLLVTHTAAAAVCAHPRNITDKQFDALRESGGLVGLAWCRDFLGGQSYELMERHLVHFWERGGAHTVCFGGDWDGTPLPSFWNGIACMEGFANYLCRKNYDMNLLSRLFFGNCYNFFARL